MNFRFAVTLFLFFVFLFLNQNTFCQPEKIYIPKQIKDLYNGPTRSWDGKPGEEYWVNRADYKINIELDADSATIEGSETITYYNNSPFDLDRIVVQLFNNFYRKGNSRDFEIAVEDVTDGIEITKLIVGEKEMNLKEEVRLTPTNMIVSNLPGAYIPHNDTINIYFEWKTKLPETSRVRTGKYEDGVIFAAYFFPKIAVYDDIYGWDELEYSGAQEFYNDFGNYDVEIKATAGYTLWATGQLQNGEEIFNKNIYEKYITAQTSDDVINIITKEDLENKNVFQNPDEKNVWKFKAENVPDFSLGASNKYLWDGVSAVVDETTGRSAFVDAAYAEGAKYYNEAALFSKRSIEFLSKESPGYPFPYPKYTSFCNTETWGGGMETPMMANNGIYSNKPGFVTLIIHEMAHTYFPFMTGVNERRYSWMDEGWAAFFPTDFASLYLEDYSHYKWYKNYYNGWNILGTENDFPLMAPSSSLRGASLTILAYARSFFAYHALQDLLGKELFKKCLNEFINRWKDKHPLPYDFFFTFNDVAGEDLSWFWKPWFYDFANCDLGIESSNAEDGSIKIKVIKHGAQPVLARVKLTFADESEETIIKPVSYWKDGKMEFEINVNKEKKLIRAEVLTDQIPDTDSSNDVIEF